MVKMLIDKQFTPGYYEPYKLACRKGHTEVVKMLLKKFSPKNTEAIMKAVEGNKVDVLQLLLEDKV